MARRIAINALQRIGHTDSTEALDAADALAKLDPTVAVVLLDRDAAGPRSDEFLHAARTAGYANVRVITMGPARRSPSPALPPARLTPADAGATTELATPFAPSVLKEAIDRLLASTVAAA